MITKHELNGQVSKEKFSKLSASTVPPEGLAYLMKVFSFGKDKYGENTWINYPISCYKDAIARHFVCVMSDLEMVDSESGLPHLAHLAADALIILSIEARKKGLNIEELIYGQVEGRCNLDEVS